MNSNTSSNRIDRGCLRGRIVKTALPMFFAKGIKLVKMDDIASSLAISKRTLYEIFPNKEELLMECMMEFRRTMKERMEESARKDSSVINIILNYYKEQMHMLEVVNPLFFEEAHKYERVVEQMRNSDKDNACKAQQFFRNGIDEGYFREDVNYGLILKISSLTMQTVMASQLYKQYGFSEIVANVNLVLLRGLCTQKGIAELDRRFGKLKQPAER